MSANFTIVKQEQNIIYGQSGSVTKEWIITFETPLGTQAAVIVGDASYNARNVAELVAAEVERIDAVNALTAGPIG